jgi:hypothetical protein
MRIFYTIIFVLLSSVSYSREDIPHEIRYLESGEKINQQTKQIITDAFNNKNFTEVFSSKVVCGPSLWASVKDHPALSEIKLTTATFNIPISAGPNAGKFQTLKGALFQSPNEIAVLSSIFESLPNTSMSIRKLNPSEVGIYWSLIPYDIEEPIFAIEFGDHVFIMDVNSSDNKVFWVDELSRYKNG